ncbi:NAD(P)/FAD-dependent oxidoreductase [Candidatus Uabimicrobium amorphum]|uniref:D-amino-acid oxidase n=1 Tax=Uabimicrobium amorphum TaxID=2596890 RepID=A0A5S9IJG5_UABAM|nr:FAD-dependent oxidoreductase [Candidatus Uabimicrobium amorphum]BBM82973.1 D-amino-acid oxidase [Candidatus Uabimicrobium amorphum]
MKESRAQMKESRVDTLIIGGGIIGLSCALEELRRNKSVCLIDRSSIGKNNASWAAAGTMVVRDVKKFFSPLRRMYVQSVQMMPEWLDFISKNSQIEIPFIKGGCYYVYDFGRPEGESEYKILFSQVNRELASDYTEMTRPPFLENYLPDTCKTVYFPNEYYLDNRALLKAIIKTCDNLGLSTREEQIEGVEDQGERIKITLRNENIYAQHCVITAGAWCGELLKYFNYALDIIPVKGQMVTIPKFYDSPAMVFFHRDLYMVPRQNQLLLGSTQERRVWEEGFNDFGEQYLRNTLHKYMANVKFEAIQKWAGIRSIIKDRYPVMGFINENKSVIISTAHYKVGFAVAPLCATCMSQLIANEEPAFDLSAFNPQREKALYPTS